VDHDPASFLHLSPEFRNRQGRRTGSWLLSTRDYRAYAAGAQTLSALAAWSPVHATLGEGDREPQLALLVTCNFFEVYGLRPPLQGRLFSPAECGEPGAAPVLLIGEELWKSQFASDPQVVGRTLRINRMAFTIAGVLPAGFAGRLRGPGIWIPWTMERTFFQGQDLFRQDSAPWLTVEGRLRPGRTRAEAQSELAVIAARLDRLETGRQTTMYVTNGSFGEEPALRAQLFWIGPVVMGALTLILLIACTNTTVLQLSRAVARRREMGIRLAVGAGRLRLTRMLLVEILLLAAAAGALSAAIAFEAPALFARFFSTVSMPVYQTAPDLKVLAYLGAIVLAATLMAGLSPAAESLRVDLHSAMKPGGGSIGAAASRRSFLVAAQVAMSLVLLVCAGLFLRAQYALFTADPGFETRRVLFVSFDPRLPAADRLRAIPGVESVALGNPLSQEEEGPARGIGKSRRRDRGVRRLLRDARHPAPLWPAPGEPPRGRRIARLCRSLLAGPQSSRPGRPPAGRHRRHRDWRGAGHGVRAPRHPGQSASLSLAGSFLARRSAADPLPRRCRYGLGPGS
jgi:predicted permease